MLRRIIPDFEVLDSKIASALKKLLTAHFKRLSTEEQKAPQDKRFLKGRQHCLHIFSVTFKFSGTGQALLDFNDLLRVQLKNDNVQDFDAKWDEVLLSMKKIFMRTYWQFCRRTSSISPTN